jgi:hypothetical protein
VTQPTYAIQTNDYRAELLLENAKAPQLLGEIEALEVNTPEDLALANALIHAVAVKKKESDAKLKAATDPINAALKEIRSWFKPRSDFLTLARALLEPKIGGYLAAQQRAREEALQAAQALHMAGNHGATAQALNVASAAETTAPGLTARYTWRAVVINPALVPYEYLTPDVAKIQGHAKGFKEHEEPTPIGGVRFEKELDLRVRSK